MCYPAPSSILFESFSFQIVDLRLLNHPTVCGRYDNKVRWKSYTSPIKKDKEEYRLDFSIPIGYQVHQPLSARLQNYEISTDTVIKNLAATVLYFGRISIWTKVAKHLCSRHARFGSEILDSVCCLPRSCCICMHILFGGTASVFSLRDVFLSQSSPFEKVVILSCMIPMHCTLISPFWGYPSAVCHKERLK